MYVVYIGVKNKTGNTGFELNSVPGNILHNAALISIEYKW